MLALINLVFLHPFVLANSAFPRTLAKQFWKSWGLRDGGIKGLQSGDFPLEEHICVEIGIDETQLVWGEMALGSRLERGVVELHNLSFGFSILFVYSEEKRFLLGSKHFCRSVFSASRMPKECFEDGIQMQFVAEDEFSLLCRRQMQRHSWAQPASRLFCGTLADLCQEKHWFLSLEAVYICSLEQL